MDQTPATASADGPVKTNSALAPPAKKRKAQQPSLFKKVNNQRQTIGTGVLPHARVAEPKTNGVKLAPFAREASPSKPTPSVQSASGFSDPRVFSDNVQFKDYKLVTTKRDVLQGLRYHLLHFAYPDPVDIRSEEKFPKPAHLHRRDARSQTSGNLKDEIEEPKDDLDAGEREELNKRKLIRQKEREDNLAQVAPNLTSGRRINNKKKTQQVHHRVFAPDRQRIMQTNYEEKLPWHLEDWNGKQVLVGQNHVGPARMHAALAFEPSSSGSTGRFRMLPVEKVYTFEPKRKELKAKKTLEEVEADMKRKRALPEVIARHEENVMKERETERERKQARGLFTGGHNRFEAGRGGEEADLDFDDDFADDEEGDLFEEKDEDEKTAEKKIKEDQLQANFLDFKDVRDFEVLDERDRREEEAKKRHFKDVRKALAKREGNYNQGSDSEDESSTDTEEERERLEAEKIANVKKEEDAAEGKTSRVPSGANTPSSRKEKHAGTASDREGGTRKSRPPKRPGSPNLSDASGTDASTTRKKKKTKHVSSSQPTPGPSRPMSPDNANLDPSSAANRVPRSSSFVSQAAGSDTEGGAMSDGTTRRIKLKVSGSAPAIKAEPRGTSPPTSRPSSPPPAAKVPITTAEEVRALIPEGGITSKEFMARAGINRERLQIMAPIIKQVARFQDGRILLKPPETKREGELKQEGEAAAVKKEGD